MNRLCRRYDGARLSDPTYLLRELASLLKRGLWERSALGTAEWFRVAAHARIAGKNPGAYFAHLVREVMNGRPVKIPPAHADAGDALRQAAWRATLTVSGENRAAEGLRNEARRLATALGSPEASVDVWPIWRAQRLAGVHGRHCTATLQFLASEDLTQAQTVAACARAAIIVGTRGLSARLACRVALSELQQLAA